MQILSSTNEDNSKDTPFSSLRILAEFTDGSSKNVEVESHTNFSGVIIDLISGTMAGTTAHLLEHPFDTVKVRLQDERCLYRGPLDAVFRMSRQEGLFSFYSGVQAPLVSSCVETSLLFAVYGLLTRTMRDCYGYSDVTELSPVQFSLAGGVAGGVVGFVLAPLDLVKCRLQVQDAHNHPSHARTVPHQYGVTNPRYRGLLHCTFHVARKEGIRSLFRGATPALLQQAVGTTFWYGSYEATRGVLAQREGITPSELSMSKVAFAGAVAGVLDWAVLYPADVVATRMRVNPQYSTHSVRGVFQAVYREGGVRALYKGCGITIVRAIPAHALLFVTYEWSRKHLERIL